MRPPPLPVCPPEGTLDARGPHTEPAPDSTPAAGTSGPRILVVDDDPVLRTIVTLALESHGLQVHADEDGESAWKTLQALTCDLLITDHQMPGLRGLDLIRRVRTVQPDLPVILISGNMPRRELSGSESSLHPGSTLEKPFTIPALLGLVRALLPGSVSARSAPPDHAALPFRTVPTQTPVAGLSPAASAACKAS